MIGKCSIAAVRSPLRSRDLAHRQCVPGRTSPGSSKRMIWAGFIFASGCAIAATQGASVDEVFRNAAGDDPRFAIGAAYALNDNDPVVMTAGPTEKNGSVMVANDARWHLGSISKSFTSTLVMRLVEQGLLDLDAPIANYLPAYRDTMHPDWQAATLRQLLSHTSGLPRSAALPVILRTWDDPPYAGRRAALAETWDKPLKGEVGEFRYSNLGYVLVGIVTEEVTQSSWEDLILSQIAVPLGFTTLGFGPPTGVNDPWGHGSFVPLGGKNPNDPANLRSDNPRWFGPAGTIHLSMAELAQWGQVHLRACDGQLPKFLTQASCQTMQTPVSEEYALGWVILTRDDGERVVWHNGSNTKWYAELAIYSDRDIVVAAATNVHALRRVHGLLLGLRDALIPDH